MPSAALTATTQPSTDTAGPTAPGNLYVFDFGCETWLWDESADDVDPHDARLGHPRRLETDDYAVLVEAPASWADAGRTWA